MFDRFLNFFNRYAVGFAHVAAELADFSEVFLRDRGGAVHYEVGVGQTRMNFLHAVDGKDLAGGATCELICAVGGANGDSERVELRFAGKFSGLIRIGQELLAGHLGIGAVAVLFVALHRFKRAEAAELTFDGNADGVSHFDHAAGGFQIVFVGGDGFAVAHERAVHHH